MHPKYVETNVALGRAFYVPTRPKQQKTLVPQGNKGFKYFVGSDGRDRTYDQLINSQLLYR